MKKFFIILVFLFITSPTLAGSINLVWDASPEPDIAGYNLYYRETVTDLPTVIDIGNKTTFEILNLTTGQFYIIEVTAYDTGGNESRKSTSIFGQAFFSSIKNLKQIRG